MLNQNNNNNKQSLELGMNVGLAGLHQNKNIGSLPYVMLEWINSIISVWFVKRWNTNTRFSDLPSFSQPLLNLNDKILSKYITTLQDHSNLEDLHEPFLFWNLMETDNSNN